MQLSTHLVRDLAGLEALPAGLDSPRTVVLVFGPPEVDRAEALAARVSEAMPSSVVAGCSTAGQIHDRSLHDDAFSIAIAQFDRVDLLPAAARVERADQSDVAAEEIAAQVNRPGLRALFVLSDGLHVNGSGLVRGLNAALPPGVVVTGGLAGDGRRFQHTWVLHDGRPLEHCISAVAFYGDALVVGHGSKSGWDLFGPERLVTRSEGPTLYELDGRPALDLYKQYLGAHAAGLPATGLLFPLSLRTGAPGEDRLVRGVLGVDEARQALTFGGDVPQGARAQLMRASADRLVQGASQAGYQGLAPRAQGPVLAIAISCVGRRLVLGERTEEEIEATLEALPATSRQVGFYSYGEIAPLADGRCDLHNQTMTLTTLGEAA